MLVMCDKNQEHHEPFLYIIIFINPTLYSAIVIISNNNKKIVKRALNTKLQFNKERTCDARIYSCTGIL